MRGRFRIIQRLAGPIATETNPGDGDMAIMAERRRRDASAPAVTARTSACQLAQDAGSGSKKGLRPRSGHCLDLFPFCFDAERRFVLAHQRKCHSG
jgi:hypothetical protein